MVSISHPPIKQPRTVSKALRKRKRCLTVERQFGLTVAHFMLEQTPKNLAVHHALFGKELPQQNMQNINTVM